MIIAKPKPIEEIIEQVRDKKRVLIAGCDGCVTVCESGGMKEVQILASALRMYFKQAGIDKVVEETSLTRQCDKPYISELQDTIGNYDAVVSLACGAGVQFLAEMYRGKIILPGVNTCFIGVTEQKGEWTERCQACGECILATTGGICPIARCSKRMSNGPCGGSSDGKCEVSKDTACGWHLIYERLKELDELQRFEQPIEPKNWAASRDGGPRKVIKEVSHE
jgi:ferredoxin